MKQTPLKAKEVNKQVSSYGIQLSKKDSVVLVDDGEKKVILVNKEPTFFYYQEKLVPTLKLLQRQTDALPQIIVDMGAVKFVVNGADVMRPGIVEVGKEICKDDFVVIVDAMNKKPLAIGVALLGTKEMREATGGKVIKSVHYIGDEIWGMS